ncbi:PTS system mannitol-specific IIC component [Salinibacterium amurskyense]|uniref:PTS system mannitol-specific EIICB component n=1 Tax=Salinibacterium amurskyense TaxID=205941 RepID=A0A2M9D7S4_9MICO|nr:PTS mannitol transporter subunit IICB [Salinibacterium amurskyense]PJJ81543.1 PTS system mannitol-specific IIC component [Salinibacterium amurskyense]RLQ83529.1 PTS mannitol transporter subunit IICB [Salinibacterium amurskyense]GHD80166.1 PTS system mannitol-specific EIICB component [Salinibacterium amurskyense]
MTTSSTTAKSGGARVGVQKFGTFVSGMVMPNIAAFIAWGFITALFIQTGWLPLLGIDPVWVQQLGGWSLDPEVTNTGLVGPMIVYLLPLLIANTGGRMVYGTRGGVIGTIATMGVIIGAGIPMFLGAMIVGPGAAWVMKKIDALWAGKIRAGFEMLVDNFSGGIVGMLLAVASFFLIAPIVTAISNGLESVIAFLVDNGLLPLASVFVEPGKILFLNNAINHGVFTPLGTAESLEKGQSILFLIEANPGPGLGILLAFLVFGVGLLRASAPGAILIHFVGGIHEIYFPYVLAKPLLVVAAIAGGATGVLTNVIFQSGLRAPASPGSIIAVLAQTPPGSIVGVLLSVVFSAAVSFAVAAVIIRAGRKRDLEAMANGDDALAAAVAKNAANKGKDSSVGDLLGTGAAATGAAAATSTATKIQNVVFACDAGMGSSAMGATVLRNKFAKAGIEGVNVTNKAIANLDGSEDLIITQDKLTERAEQKVPGAIHVSVDNFMNSPKYDEVVNMVGK